MVENIDFRSPGHGLVTIANCATGRGGLYRTADGGRSWRFLAAAAPDCAAGSLTFGRVVGASGWLVTLYPTGPGARIERTLDGGADWSAPVGTPPELGGIAFPTPLRGWLGRDPALPVDDGWRRLYVTQDGGLHWWPANPPAPAGDGRLVTARELPSFFGPAVGIEPVTFVRRRIAWVVFDRTGDGGHSWQLGRPQELGQVPAGPFPAAVDASIASPSVWWMLSARARTVSVTRDAGLHWHRYGLPLSGAFSILAAGPDTAWLLVQPIRSRGQRLYQTVGGGRTWTRLQPF